MKDPLKGFLLHSRIYTTWLSLISHFPTVQAPLRETGVVCVDSVMPNFDDTLDRLIMTHIIYAHIYTYLYV